jgi:ABC-type enterochelin transport system permease subunit
MRNNNSLQLITLVIFIICSILNWIKYSNTFRTIDFVAAIVFTLAFLGFSYQYFKNLKQNKST